MHELTPTFISNKGWLTGRGRWIGENGDPGTGRPGSYARRQAVTGGEGSSSGLGRLIPPVINTAQESCFLDVCNGYQ